MKHARQIVLGACLLAAAGCAPALGAGMLIPKDESIPPLAIKHQRVDIRVNDGVAAVRVEQVFRNSTDRDLEAVYVFPLPEGATIADFGMYINGKRVSGEVVERGKARSIYEDIVRRMRDPGLLEHMGDNLFRVSVYPVPRQGEQKFEIEYAQQLPFESGLYRLAYPMKTGERASRLLEDFTVGVRLQSSTPLKTIYSPSHAVGITRKGEREAVIGFEENRAMLDRDFVLYYGISAKQFGLNLLTHRPEKQDGYFMMMIAPPVQPPDGKALPKDVTFVFDTSGSMAGEKIEQARKALQYCVRRLNDGDRFNVIRFSTDVETFKPERVAATATNRAAAAAFVAGMEARGGTAIHEALQTALAVQPDGKRPTFVVFLTDGQPTIGETDPEIVAKGAAERNRAGVRLFVFGVGEEVNARLLDRISSGNGGVSAYVKPGEDIEVKVSALADKISQPVLSHPVVAIDKLTVRDVHPKDLPDLFAGEQLTVCGRYQGNGHVAIRLTGNVNGEKREFVFEQTFPAVQPDNAFIARLWATRRVGYLLESIRLHGNNKELEDEVIRLGKEHGIMTPYTSYLVLEDDRAYEERGIKRTGLPATGASESAPKADSPVDRMLGGAATDGRRSAPGGSAWGARNGFREQTEGARPEAPAKVAAPVFDSDGADLAIQAARFRQVAKSGVAGRVPVAASRLHRVEASVADKRIGADTGEGGIVMSEAIARYKRADTLTLDSSRVKRVDGKVFYRVGEVWVDSEYREGGTERKVAFAGKEYFALLGERPALKNFLALGEKVIVVLDGTAYIVE